MLPGNEIISNLIDDLIANSSFSFISGVDIAKGKNLLLFFNKNLF